MSTNYPTFTIHIEQTSEGLQVTVPEIGADFTIQGDRDAAIDAAHTAIEQWVQRQREQESAKAG